MKNLSVDEILDDLKQKKSGTQANSPATSVDVDRLITEIIEEKKKTGPSDKEPDIPTVTIPAPTQPLSKPQTEKFTVRIQCDEDETENERKIVSEPKKAEQAEHSISTVDLLRESIADQIGATSAQDNVAEQVQTEEIQESEPMVRIISDGDDSSRPEHASELSENEPTKHINNEELPKKTSSFKDVAEDDETVLPDPRAFEHANEDSFSQDEEEDFFEYRSPEDERKVYTEILSTRGKLVLRIVLLAIFGGASLVLALLQEFSSQMLPAVLQKTEQPLLYLVIQFVLQICCLLSCCSMVGEGLIAAFKLRATRDSLPALAALTGLIQTVVCFFEIDLINNTAVHLYTPVIAGTLLCGCAAKLMMVNRMALNFRVVSSPYEKYTTVLIDDENAALELTRGSLSDIPTVAVQRRTEFVTDFIAYSTDEDVSDSCAKYLTPVGVGFALLLGIVSGIMTGNLCIAFTTAAAVMCVFAPFSFLFMVQLPMSRVAKKYSRDGGVVLSPSESDDFSYTNAAVVTAHDLFPGNSVKLFGIKTFAGQRIDEALMDAASVIRESGSVLTNVFAQIIAGDETLLRPVDSLVYEDGMGISAWVANKRVLIGSRELMINHGISVPSRDYEERYLNEGHDLIYLSTSGELTAVFLVKFFAAPEVKYALGRLSDNGISLTIKSVDAVITKQKMAEIFDEDPSFFKILPSRLHSVYDQYASVQERGGSSVLSNGTFQSFAGSLIGAKRLRISILLGSILQFAAVGVGLLMMIILTLISGMSEMKVSSLFLYQIIWLVLTLLLPRLKSV